MFRNYCVSLFALCLSHALFAQLIEDITIIPEDPVEGEEIITRFSGEFPGGSYEIETEEFEIRDHELLITLRETDTGVGIDVMTPFSHDQYWGELSEGDWRLYVFTMVYYFDEEMDDPEFVEDYFAVYDIEIGEAEENIRFYTGLERGWRIISFPIIPNELEIPDLFGEIVDADRLEFIKDYQGWFYAPAYEFNGIPEWNPLQGYHIKMRRGAEFTIVGTHHEERMNTEIPLIDGWNIVPYQPVAQVSAEIAFRNIEDILIMAKDDHGRFYSPENDFIPMLGINFTYLKIRDRNTKHEIGTPEDNC